MELIIPAEKKHLDDLMKMGKDLWSEESDKVLKNLFLDIINSNGSGKNKILICVKDEETAAFVYLSIRTDYVEGSASSPTGYIEGIYVKPGFRKKGIARKLLIEGEKWIKGKGCTQVGSDAYIDNKLSYDFHTGVGFKVAGKLITFIKDIV